MAQLSAVDLAFGPSLPTTAAMARHVRDVRESWRASGRGDVTLVLRATVVEVADEAAVRRRRAVLGTLDAMAGLSWSPTATWLVTTPATRTRDVRALVDALGVDALDTAATPA